MSVTCPECDNPLSIDADEMEKGDTLTCEECGVQIEILNTDPLEIAPQDETGYDEEDRTATHDEDEE